MPRATRCSTADIRRLQRSRTYTPEAHVTRLRVVLKWILRSRRNGKSCIAAAIPRRPTSRTPPLKVIIVVPVRRQVRSITATATIACVLVVMLTMLRRQPELLFLGVISVGSVGLVAHARVPGLIRIKRAETAATAARDSTASTLVCAGRGPGVPVLEAADPVVEPADDAAGRGLGRAVRRGRGGFEEGDI